MVLPPGAVWLVPTQVRQLDGAVAGRWRRSRRAEPLFSPRAGEFVSGPGSAVAPPTETSPRAAQPNSSPLRGSPSRSFERNIYACRSEGD